MTAVAMDVGDDVSNSHDTDRERVESTDEMGDQGDGGEGSMAARKAANPAFSKFMQGFWDLASVEVPVRTEAAAMIVRHVSNPETAIDAAYAVKRLVRGVCSSRDSARQGFASCLAEVLHVLPNNEPTTAAILEQILSVTTTTSSMKSAEERELMLGRLIGVSALALSGRLGKDKDSAAGALKAVSELYPRRKWLGQAAGEACLLVTSKAFEGEGEFAGVALPLLAPLFKRKDGVALEMPDLTSNQLMLALGLRSVMRARGLEPQKDETLKETLPPCLRSHRAPKAQDMMAALKQSASVFPKVHSVWGHLWDDIGLAPVGQPRAILSSKRLKRLADVWSTVVDGTLTSTSLNNRGFAILLLKQVLQRVPAAGVWHVLSPSIVRIMLNHTHGEDSHLFSLVKMTLQQLPELVRDDEEVQGQLAACLLLRGTMRFDSLAGVHVVASLVRSMGQEALDKHVDFLKGAVQGKTGWAEPQGAIPNGTSPAAGTEAETSPNGAKATITESGEDHTGQRLQAVETLHSLGRSGDGANGQGQRLSKTAEFFLEMGFFAPLDEATPVPAKVRELCRSKFFSLVADIAAKPWLSWSSKDNKGKSDGESSKWEALEALWGLHEAWQRLEADGRKLAKCLTVGPDEREACAVALAMVGKVREGQKGDKLAYAFAGILMMVALHLLDGSREEGRGEERCQHILDIVETYARISGTGKGGDGDGGDDDDDSDDDDGDDPDPLAMLADVLVGVVAEPSSHSVRGLRDSSRRVWSIVCRTLPLTRSALDTLLAAVCGEDTDASPAGAEADSSEAESSSEEEDEEDDMDKEDGEDASGKTGDADPSSDEDHEEDKMDEDEDDEVTVDPSDLEALLSGRDKDGDSDDDGEDLQHHEGADQALAGLIGLKKSGRKKGMQEAQRQAHQIRLRALDFLEVLCARSLHSPHLIGALLPILNAIKKLTGSSGLGNRNGGEASALLQRLETLYHRLCKCKPRVDEEASSSSGDSPEDFHAQTAEVFSKLIALCRSWEKNPPLASLALEGGMSCLKSLKGCPGAASEKASKGSKSNGVTKEGKKDAALDAALAELAAAVAEFFEKKRGAGLTATQVEEVVKRFPDDMVPVLVKAATGAAVSDFLRVEAFRLVGDVLRRRGQLNSVSRKNIIASCPAIIKALVNVLTAAAAAAEAVASARTAESSAEGGKDASMNGTNDTGTKDAASTNAQAANPASALPSMLKSKRLKPLLGCLSVSIKAMAEPSEGTGRNSLSALHAEVTALNAALIAVAEASANLSTQRACDSVASELHVLGQVEEGAEMETDVPHSREGGAAEETPDEDKRSKKKKKKSRRESDAAEDEAGREETERSNSKKKKEKRASDDGMGHPQASEEMRAGTSPVGDKEQGDSRSKSERKAKVEKAKRRKTRG